MLRFIIPLILWLFVINLGIGLGAGLYEHQIVIPQWLVVTGEGAVRWDAAAAREANTGLRFWVYVSTVSLTLLTLASLAAAWGTQGAKRRWWLAAAGIVLVERVFTFAYFIPTMIGLMEPGDLSEPVAVAQQWSNLNYLRHLLTLVGWLAALRAFSLPTRPPT